MAGIAAPNTRMLVVAPPSDYVNQVCVAVEGAPRGTAHGGSGAGDHSDGAGKVAHIVYQENNRSAVHGWWLRSGCALVNAHAAGMGLGVEALLGRDVAVVAGAEAQNRAEGCPGNIDLTYRGRRRVLRVIASASAGKHAQQEKGQNEMICVPLHAE